MDYVPSLLNRYYEIFQFIINSDQYQEFIYLKKKTLLPYSYLLPVSSFCNHNSDEIPDSSKSPDQWPLTEVESQFKRMLELYDQIVERVWEKFSHRLTDIDEWDTDLDQYDVFHLLGGTDPLLIMPATAESAGITHVQMKAMGLEQHKFFIIGIDPQLNRKDAWHQLQQMLKDHLGGKSIPRNLKKRTIPRQLAFKLAREGRTFDEIGLKFGVDRSTAQKAFVRDFEDRYGKKFKSGTTDRKNFPIHQASKTCDSCTNRKSCTKLCPEMKAFADQDYVSQKDRLAKKQSKSD